MKKIAAAVTAVLVIAATAYAQSNKTYPRVNSGPALALSASPPSGTPFPEVPPNPTSVPPRTPGQSSTINGALHLVGCSGYRITLCAPPGQTLAGAGTVQVYYWPDYLSPSNNITVWPRNKGLDETVPTTSATDCNGGACRCVTFPDHPTFGLNGGWIYAAPNAVTLSGSGPSVTVLIEAVCAS